MATSRTSPPSSSSTQETRSASSGLSNGSGPDQSGSMPAPKPPSKSRVKAKPLGGTSTEAKPAEGLSTAKPVSKAKGRSQPKGPAAAKEVGSVRDSGTDSQVDYAAGSADAAQGAGRAQVAETAPVVKQAASAGDAIDPSAAVPTQLAATPPGERMSDEERQRRIAERAYRKAQERGFGGDRHLDDWLEAEREHDRGS